MNQDELNKVLAQNDSEAWERSLKDTIQEDAFDLEDWIYVWIYHRLQWPDSDFSLFYTNTILMEASIKGLTIRLKSGDTNKRRWLILSIYKDNPYHPDYEEKAQVSPEEWRFPSVGNPYIDEPNFKVWEQMLFAKLFSTLLIKQKGLEFLIENFRGLSF